MKMFTILKTILTRKNVQQDRYQHGLAKNSICLAIKKQSYLLFKKLDRGYSEQEFVFTYFTSAITKKPSEYKNSELYVIKSQLKKGNSLFSNWLWEEIDMMADEEYIKTFGAEYEECKKIIEEAQKQELPF